MALLWDFSNYLAWVTFDNPLYLFDGSGPSTPLPVATTTAASGQTLSPNADVYAPAGFGGGLWGANGGGITPTASPKSPLTNMANATRDATNVIDQNGRTVKGGLSNAAVSARTSDLVYAGDTTTNTWNAGMEAPVVADSQL